ncbi:uncharacterized protein EDB91DRAFT_1277270 [Suillus paluster]|uniref:uncharacterized protein n=1 Tax=Suillus paluster TaxID=48578 RepID=UPI001B87724A|nr:uncharacterized protein EDB91DRAFT_1277270 [Suillus paluster]KAG1755133.1 hypothetical protein EDB91DRAFT_1277270 [Suillus paluster]
MPSYTAPPPNYSPGSQNPPAADDALISGLQIFIIPAADTLTFQKGYLGAEGERAAIEGEIHVKGAQPGQWKYVTVALRAVESASGQEIELGSSEINLVSFTGTSDSMSSSTSFAIPLTSDAPQCIHTPHSLLEYALTATFHPINTSEPVVSRRVVVHTRRYTSHSHTVDTLPETHVLESPSHVEVQVPRTIFRAGEPIPVYITVPPPSRQLMLREGLRLRNVKTEIVRIVSIKGQDDGGYFESGTLYGSSIADLQPQDGPSLVGPTPSAEKPPITSPGSTYRTVTSRSGASCRFHSSRPVRLRFILHQASPSASPVDYQRSLPEGDYSNIDNDLQCTSITQSTLLHSVSFLLNIHISFVDTTNRTERLTTVPIPLTIIPPPAPLPEVEEWIDAAYQKKHDRPPLRTVRQEDSEPSIPIYQEGEAGPSYTQSGAPPPFEDRDIPPPPFFHSMPSTSNAPPSFQESESEIFISSDTTDQEALLPTELTIVGEGILFGFTASEQFDGHSDTMHRSSTPPPSVEMAERDTDVTGFADIGQSVPVFEALNIVLDDSHAPRSGGELPPPPPAMDDPSDPPPSIDSDFRSPTVRVPVQSHSPPLAHQSYSQAPATRDSLHPPSDILHHSSPHGHAPPPYLVPGSDHDQEEHVTRPPPYMDLVPSSSFLNSSIH